MQILKLKKYSKKVSQGFTLLEILLVVGIIAILAGIVIIAINPAKQLADARNAQRRSDVNAISNALYQYILDHQTGADFTINGLSTSACGTESGTEICRTDLDDLGGCPGDDTPLDFLTTSGTYLTQIPYDPTGAGKGDTTGGSGYFVTADSAYNRMTVCAPYAENGASISVTR